MMKKIIKVCFKIFIIAIALVVLMNFIVFVLPEKAQAYLGVAEAQFNMGVNMAGGKDFEEAVKWYRKAAVQGHVHAEGSLKRLGFY